VVTPVTALHHGGTYRDVVLDPDLPVPLHEQLAEILRAKIKSGEYTGRLPSARHLAQEHGVSHRTSEHALRTLKGEGLVVPLQGKGYYVKRS
jgi:DNA-binding GntR family transcriptional regulator